MVYFDTHVIVPTINAFTLTLYEDSGVSYVGGVTHIRQSNVLGTKVKEPGWGVGLYVIHKACTGPAHQLDSTPHQTFNPHQGELFM